MIEVLRKGMKKNLLKKLRKNKQNLDEIIKSIKEFQDN